MEITLLKPTSLRIKGKSATAVVSPDAKGKYQADVALSLTLHEIPLGTFEEQPLFVTGPGEYESKGMKITGMLLDSVLSYQITLDGITTVMTKGNVIGKAKDKFEDAEVLVILADEVVSQAAITALDPYVVVLFGEKAEESAKGLGKESAPVGKYVVTKDKLPSEMEVVCLM